MHNMTVHGRVPWEASMEYFIKKQTNKQLKVPSKLNKQHLLQIIETTKGHHKTCNLTEGLDSIWSGTLCTTQWIQTT